MMAIATRNIFLAWPDHRSPKTAPAREPRFLVESKPQCLLRVFQRGKSWGGHAGKKSRVIVCYDQSAGSPASLGNNALITFSTNLIDLRRTVKW